MIRESGSGSRREFPVVPSGPTVAVVTVRPIRRPPASGSRPASADRDQRRGGRWHSRSDRPEPMREIPGRREYPIAAVSKLTGVSCHALRVWERRYGFPIPHRTPAGHRRYRHEQVLILRRLSEIVARRASSIGDLIADVLAGRLASTSNPSRPARPSADGRRPRRTARPPPGRRLLDGADASSTSSQQRLGPADLVARVIAPALDGDRRALVPPPLLGLPGALHQRYSSGASSTALIDEARRANTRPDADRGDRHGPGRPARGRRPDRPRSCSSRPAGA